MEPVSRATDSEVGTKPFIPDAEATGCVIAGRYKLLQKLGEGGFGIVYMAEQREPVHRTVALKIIKPGMDSAQVIGRFEQERQALALMDHPNIAKVLDGGTIPLRMTDDGLRIEESLSANPQSAIHNPQLAGRPYFVMELVHGISITRFCDEQRLTARQRLELFLPVCQAIQHAHQKGIIHRDLKPSNVLVTLQDGKPAPKVIDFGVAKAVTQRLTERTMFTEIGALIGTPEYMAPEQAGVNPLDIDTRSDLYSLGVLLYELLTGTTPLDRKRLRQAGYDEVLRLIREVEPAKPSSRITTIEELPTIASRRQVEPKQLQRLLRGDLDWVVMKALEKDRSRRYETAYSLALDIQRYLRDEPVLAGPPSAAYRLRKFLKRNQGPVLAAGLVLLVLVAGFVGTSLGLLRALSAEREARRQKLHAEANFQQAKQAIDEFYVRFSKRLADHPGAQPVRKELLEAGLAFYERFLQEHQDDPSVQAELAMTYWRVGRIRQDLGEIREAAKDYQQALTLQEELAAAHPEVLRYREQLAASCNNLGLLLGRLGNASAALQHVNRGLALRSALHHERPDDLETLNFLASSHSNLAILHEFQGDAAEALRHHQKALELRLALVERKPGDAEFVGELAKSHNNLGTWHFSKKADAEARQHYGQALELWQKLQVRAPASLEVQVELAKVQYNLGLLHQRQQHPVDAERHFLAAEQVGEELVRGSPALPAYRRSLAQTCNGLGVAQEALGKKPEAAKSLRRAYELRVQLNPQNQDQLHELAQSAMNLGAILQKLGSYADGLPIAERAAVLYERLVHAEPGDASLRTKLMLAYNNLGAIRSDAGDPAAALIEFDKARKLSAELPQREEVLIDIEENRELALERLKRWDEAVETQKQVVAGLEHIFQQRPGSAPSRSRLSEAYAVLARLYRELGRPKESADVALARQKLWPTDPSELYRAACELTQCMPLVARGKAKPSADEAKEVTKYAEAALRALRAAIALGYQDVAQLRQHADLDPLRSRADFQQLVKDLESKAGSATPPSKQ